MKSSVSVRWQTVIPQEVREALKIEPNSKLEWELKDGYTVVYSVPANPVRASLGFFKKVAPVEGGRMSMTDELLSERGRDLERDEEMERRLGLPPREE